MRACLWTAINCTVALLDMTTSAEGNGVAIGDSLALGFGRASHLPTIAREGEPSCPNRYRRGIVNMVPAEHFDFALISAGTNDVPGDCIEAIRNEVHADHVMWVVPVNGAREHVLRVAREHGDALLYYAPSVSNWPHPVAYWNVLKEKKL